MEYRQRDETVSWIRRSSAIAATVVFSASGCGMTDPRESEIPVVVVANGAARAGAEPKRPWVIVAPGELTIRGSVISSASNYPLSGVRHFERAGSVDIELRSGPPVGIGIQTIWEKVFEAYILSLAPGTYRVRVSLRAIERATSHVSERLDTTVVVD
jgi:hypothetical protein